MASNMYIKFDKIDGESTDKNHIKWIEILGWSHSFSQPTPPMSHRNSSGSTLEKCHHSELTFSKYLDVATDDLLKTCWTGKQVETVKIECFRADGQTTNAIKYLMIDMLDVIITNLSISGGGGDIPVENLSLSYSKITYTYIDKKKADGTGASNQPVSWDHASNENS
ncbi:MAG: type VI secretion system tube protein Hcp [Desulfobacterales bacterium]|nr:type VI secretion system tube protein Hcp [Desulfobacterales bacterium]